MKKIGSRRWLSEYIYYKKGGECDNQMWRTENVDYIIAEKYSNIAQIKMIKKQYRHWSIHQTYKFPAEHYSNPWDFYNGITPIILRPLVNPLILCSLNTIAGHEQLHIAKVFSIVFTQIL